MIKLDLFSEKLRWITIIFANYALLLQFSIGERIILLENKTKYWMSSREIVFAVQTSNYWTYL